MTVRICCSQIGTSHRCVRVQACVCVVYSLDENSTTLLSLLQLINRPPGRVVKPELGSMWLSTTPYMEISPPSNGMCTTRISWFLAITREQWSAAYTRQKINHMHNTYTVMHVCTHAHTHACMNTHTGKPLPHAITITGTPSFPSMIGCGWMSA